MMPNRMEPATLTERPIGRNDPCHCGQQKKYKNCCWDKDRATGRRPIFCTAPVTPLTDLTSLRQNTLDFIQCLRGDLDIVVDPRSGVGTIGEIDDGAVKRTFGRLPYFFPHDADYGRVYQDIADLETSGMYWGERDGNSVATYLARYALYTPHILVANPFCDRSLYHMDVSPVEHPQIWRQVVANRAMFLVSIEPWIREGVVTVLPPVKWAHWQLHDDEMGPRAEKRLDKFTAAQARALERRSLSDLIVSLHPSDLAKFIRAYTPDVPATVVAAIERDARRAMAENPARYAWSGPGDNQVINAGPGNNLDSAVYQAALCKSYLLLGDKGYRDEYEWSLEQADTELPRDAYTRMSKAFGTITFSFLNSVKLDFVLGLRKDNRLASLRRFLHDTWKQASTVEGMERLNQDSAFRESLEAEYAKYKHEWKDIQKGLVGNVVAGTLGAGLSVLSGQFGLAIAAGGLAAFKLKELVAAKGKREASERLPLGVFLQLERGH
jgi:hypothetical protein